MKILLIAPFPPPINGQSLAADVLCRELYTTNDVKLVNMSKGLDKNLKERLYRYFSVSYFILQACIKQYDRDVIYLTISESVAGNIKDIFIYLVCYRNLNKTFIHMLGGAGMKSILEKRGVLYNLNKYFIGRMRGVIVEGQSQANTFSQLISRDNIHIVPNFAEDYLFVSEDIIKDKFSNASTVQILFLSNLLYGKGHNELVDAYISLSDDMKDNIRVVFVGGFESEKDKNDFFKKIENYKNILYYGNFVTGDDKKKLYCESHIFCLPTYYPYEGQPISILEAYATGCVVITTNHSGIPDVFSDNVNGYAVEMKSSESIRNVIENCVDHKDKLINIALNNRGIAYNKYRTHVYNTTLLNIFRENLNC